MTNKQTAIRMLYDIQSDRDTPRFASEQITEVINFINKNL